MQHVTSGALWSPLLDMELADLLQCVKQIKSTDNWWKALQLPSSPPPTAQRCSFEPQRLPQPTPDPYHYPIPNPGPTRPYC